MGQFELRFTGAGREVAKRADNFLPWPFGSVDGFHQQVVGVELVFVFSRGFADIHGHYSS